MDAELGDAGGWCHRFPMAEETGPRHWCGEWQGEYAVTGNLAAAPEVDGA